MKNIANLLSPLKKKKLFHEVIYNKKYYTHIPTDFKEYNITHLSMNSTDTQLSQDTLFFAKGKGFKKEYLLDTLHNGVIFYVSEIDYEFENTVAIIVEDIEKAMALIAQYFYDFPDKQLKLIGVTGTKGKTTTSYFLQEILSHEDKPAGLINSSKIYTGNKERESTLTTPESLDIYRYLDEMVQNNLAYCVLEVSSQAYKRKRVYGLEFDISLFLNFSEDHVGTGEHESMEEYFYCKRQLLLHSKNVVLNEQLTNFEFIKKEIKEKNQRLNNIYTFSTKEKTRANYFIQSQTINQFNFIKYADNAEYFVTLSMYGYYNHENAAASLIIGEVFGEDINKMINKIKNVHVDGRFQIYQKEDKIVVIDYAHNETSFRNVISSGRQYFGKNRPFSIVGSTTGGKAENRRQGVARVLAEVSPSMIYMAADDPNFTPVDKISKEIMSLAYKQNPYLKFDTTYQEQREKQIQKALSEMGPDDILFILGKGTDRTQKVNGKSEEYIGDDVLVNNWLKE